MKTLSSFKLGCADNNSDIPSFTIASFFAILLAFAGLYLIFGDEVGSFSLGVFFTLLFAIILPLNKEYYFSQSNKFIVFACVFSIGAVFFDANFFVFNLTLLFLLALRLTGSDNLKLEPTKYIIYFLTFAFTWVFEPFMYLQDSKDVAEKSKSKFKDFSFAKYAKISCFGFLILSIIALIGFIFLGLFSSANPEVKKFADGIFRFLEQFFNIKWEEYFKIFLKLAVIFVFVIAFLRLKFLRSFFNNFEKKYADITEESKAVDSPWLKFALFSGLILFNLIFLLENFFDLKYIFTGMKLPEGITHSAYANEGAFMLAVVTLIAASLIILCFRQTNDKWKNLKILVYIWIAQNIMLTISASIRLIQYTKDFDLTLMRFNAFVFFFIVACGFVFVVVKIAKNKNIFWLINANIYLLFTVSILYSLFDRNALVANYNVQSYIESDEKNLDLSYLESLGKSALPAAQKLMNYIAQHPEETRFERLAYYPTQKSHRKNVKVTLEDIIDKAPICDTKFYDIRELSIKDILISKKLNAELKKFEEIKAKINSEN